MRPLLFLLLIVFSFTPVLAQEEKKKADKKEAEREIAPAPPAEFGISEQGDAAVKEKNLRKDSLSWLRNGTKLTYNVNPDSGKPYKLMITDLRFGYDLTYNYTTSADGRTPGGMIMTPSALEDLHMPYDSEISWSVPHPWINRKSFKELSAGKATLNKFSGEKVVWTLERKESYKLTIDGVSRSVNVLYAKAGNGDELWIYDNIKTPLVLKMKSDYSYTLKKAETK